MPGEVGEVANVRILMEVSKQVAKMKLYYTSFEAKHNYNYYYSFKL